MFFLRGTLAAAEEVLFGKVSPRRDGTDGATL